MKRWILIVGAAAMTVFAASQSQASWSVIRWSSGFCEVWDNGLPTKPLMADYKVLKTYKTADKAMNKRVAMSGKGCW